jgi:hypothetical protein
MCVATPGGDGNFTDKRSRAWISGFNAALQRQNRINILIAS